MAGRSEFDANEGVAGRPSRLYAGVFGQDSGFVNMYGLGSRNCGSQGGYFRAAERRRTLFFPEAPWRQEQPVIAMKEGLSAPGDHSRRP